jgi:hypothetical protein
VAAVVLFLKFFDASPFGVSYVVLAVIFDQIMYGSSHGYVPPGLFVPGDEDKKSLFEALNCTGRMAPFGH